MLGDPSAWSRDARGCSVVAILVFSRVLKEHRQRAVEDNRDITGRHAVAQEVLDAAQLLERVGADRKLHLVALRRQLTNYAGLAGWVMANPRPAIQHASSAIGDQRLSFPPLHYRARPKRMQDLERIDTRYQTR
jgi:hypothetical protein